MSYDLNKVKIERLKSKRLFLIDASAFCRLEELASITGVHLLLVMKKSSKVHFLITNEVWVELMNGPRIIKPRLILDHIINVEGGMSYDLKEN